MEQYYNLNEAILEVFDQGFTSNDFETTEAKIYEYKQNNDFSKDTLSQKPYNYKDKSKVIPMAEMNLLLCALWMLFEITTPYHTLILIRLIRMCY